MKKLSTSVLRQVAFLPYLVGTVYGVLLFVALVFWSTVGGSTCLASVIGAWALFECSRILAAHARVEVGRRSHPLYVHGN